MYGCAMCLVCLPCATSRPSLDLLRISTVANARDLPTFKHSASIRIVSPCFAGLKYLSPVTVQKHFEEFFYRDPDYYKHYKQAPIILVHMQHP